jgi:hypothetical protein
MNVGLFFPDGLARDGRPIHGSRHAHHVGRTRRIGLRRLLNHKDDDKQE